jgi:tetratricopeptide (TPR) repeat protein
MTVTRPVSVATIVLAAFLAAFVSPPAAAQDTLARAKDLYASAAYDEALALLNKYDHATGAEGLEVEVYRAFCLLALGRGDEARKVIQQIVEVNPSYQPSQAQMSPRLVETFRDVRRRVLPTIVRQSYAEAKASFEHKDFELAEKQFEQVIALLGDGDLVASTGLSDLRILSNGFLDLIKTMPQIAKAVPQAAPQPALASPIRPEPAPLPAIYGLEDPEIIPPVAISQVMPPWHPARQESQSYEGTLILVIDEKGDVASVSSQGNLAPYYALLLNRAAKNWKFRPATRNGVPVKFRKIVAVRLNQDRPARSQDGNN